MNFLAIDFGNYSIKFIQYSLDRKNIKLHRLQEVILSQFTEQLSETYSLQELQLDVARSYIKEIGHEGKLVFCAPDNLITHRVLHLPVKNKKKAKDVIPFQLEEDVPYTPGDLHFASVLIPESTGFNALVALSSINEIGEYFTKLDQKNLTPYFLSTAPSVYLGHCFEQHSHNNVAILDLGHYTTKAHVFKQGRPISTHISYTAGKAVNEVIAESYNISISEAIEYKHQNSFFLTESQLKEVTIDQKEFALLMKGIFAPLINDIRKWELGLRVKYGEKIEELLLTGGSSNITNIVPYLAETLKIKVQYLDTFTSVHSSLVSHDAKERRTYNFSHLMAKAFVEKIPLLNLRSGAFASSEHENIPLYSSAFLLSRAFILIFILFISLVIESYLLSGTEKNLDTRITRILKNPEFSIPTRIQHDYQKNPDVVYKFFKKKEVEVSQEIRSIQTISQTGPLFPLIKLGNIVGDNSNVELIHFSNQENKIEASFKGHDLKSLNDLEKSLKSSGLDFDKIKIKEKEMQLELEYSEEA